MIGKNIKAIRLNKGMTLEQLAEKLGKSYPHIQAIESGRSQPKDETILDMLIKGFDLPYSEALNLLSQWRIEDALKKASDPSSVINNVINSDHTIVINDGQHTINQTFNS